MGRKKDPIWDHVEKLNNKVFKCKYCGEEFAGGASRIKSHLFGIEGKGIRKCIRVPKDVQIAASSAFDDSSKTHPRRDFVDSSKGAGVLVLANVPEECILFPELFQRATVPTINDSNNQCIIKNVNSGSLQVNCLNSNESAVGNVNSSNPMENYLISSQSITRNINSNDPSKGL
ncbi:hypothetical protein L6164_002277 [Bauhinia variegata]|uniref:Uncharacterized protein n=1 Tax=Bauhinia variegata TaxID=167791 RepID=A0ACB9PXP2_BAUVA|nr:hypothetical protein L6164_002277 [Bauhinia variegata]